MGVYNATENKIKLFINGGIDNEKNLTFSIWNTSRYIEIGRGSDYSYQAFKGIIDKVCVYTCALTSDEIHQIYEEDNKTTPSVVYVDGDYNNSTTGWQYDHFNKIQDGIDAVAENGTVYVYNGTYCENVIVNKSVNIIGENKNTTIIDGGGTGNVIEITVDNTTIQGFTIRNSGSWPNAGVKIYSSNNSIYNCNISNNNNGILLWDSINNNIYDCNFINDGIIIWGYELSHFIHNIYTNTVNGKPLLYYKNENNIVLDGIEAGQIILANCSNFEIRNMNISHTTIGIEIAYSNNINIYNCNISYNYYGIYTYYSSNNSIYNCNISYNYYGIWLDWCSYNNSIYNCNISNNWAGLEMDDNTYNNSIYNCNISNNWYGTRHELSYNNSIYMNNFIDNNYNVYSYNSDNIWHSPEPITYTYNSNTYTNYLGNYWDDYNGSDADNDGIGDTPFYIRENDYDYYPLMETWENYILPRIFELLLTWKAQDMSITDQTIIMIHPNASIGQDEYDQPDLGMPPGINFNAWLDAGLPTPYDKLLRDARPWNDSITWNLYCQWQQTCSIWVNISWNNSIANELGEDETLLLIDGENIINMKQQSYYNFTLNPWIPKQMQIKYFVKPPVTFITSLPIGWSLFAIPFNDTISLQDIIVSFNNTNYTWQEATESNLIMPWIYTVNRTTGMYEVAYELMPGYGYWIYCYMPVELWINGSYSNGNYINPSIGWNLISAPCNYNISLNNLTIIWNSNSYTWQEAINESLIMPWIYTVNRNNGMYEAVDELKQGYGYWIYCYEDIEIK